LPDVPGDSSTTATITVGGTVSSTLETLGDHDWFRITLTAGQSITVFVHGTTLEDSYLYIRNAAGTVIYENDDINPGIVRDSQLSFTVTSTGTYYIDVGSFDESYTGDYQVSVSVYTPPPLATYDQIADQLVNGYWGGDDHHFNVSQGGSITVNITTLTPAGQNLAREALKLWGDVIGVQFVEVTSGGQITFDDDQDGAFTEGNWSGGIISSSHVNISTGWLAAYGAGINSYSFQTYVHEIGHALGLGHAGNYNGSATYPYDASFQNDAWVTSVMSYFSQTDNTYFAGQGFSEDFVVTPMLADIVAMQTLYGLSTTTRTGDTTYGFNSTAGRAVYNASLNPHVAYTIFDSGGTDTLDYSGFNANQLINLNPETFSNVGSDIGNVSIGRGVVIENAIGGSGNDTFYGNSAANHLTGNAGNDTLDGGAGADVMTGGLGDDRYYIDNAGDTIVEAANQGDDIAFVLGTYTLAQGVSVETLVALNQSSTDPLVLTGNEFGQSLYGNLGDNYLNGGQGNDFLVGLAGNDNLLGGTGADDMQGGTGNDVYYADQAGDRIFENVGEGSDLVVATATYTLTDGAQVETMSADPNAGNINLTGNEFAQSIYGNAGNNNITGMGGADYLVGGAGNDTYYVDPSDFIGEVVGGGDDTIVIATSYILREGNEIETLVALNQDSTDPVNLTGNEFGQSLYGSQGNNMLNGGGGNDFLVGLGGNDFLIGGPGNDNMQGGAGNDLYYVEDSGDQIFENAGEGDDLAVCFTSFALGAGQSVETLSALEGTAAINLTGNALAQSLYGNAGANVLTSGGGADYMVGGAGNDTFVLTNAPGVSTIGDYSAGDVVDITQYLSVANGTDVVAGGYLRLTSGGQLQVDVNGGGDSYVTLSNVNGSGAVTVRYLAGGSATDLSAARSASQSANSAAMAGALAAAGMAAIVPADATSVAASGDHQTAPAIAMSALAIAATPDLAFATDGSRTLPAHEMRAPIDDSGSPGSSSIGTDAPIAAADPLALHATALQAALEPGTELAAAAAPAIHALLAPAIAMPSADQLLAQDHGGSGSAEAAQHNPLVSQALVDALADGTGSATIDALLSALPGGHGGATGIDHATVLVDAWHGPAFGAFGADPSFHTAFALNTTPHPDAPPAA
jgi:serralysin